jgi:leader peptidase (prepilin peptidase)/N-methyltransferase
MLASLLALACIDLELLVLPRKIIYPTFVLIAIFLFIAAGAYGQWTKLEIAGICAAAWFSLFYVMNFVSPRALGFGDVRLALVLGLGLGWFGWRYVVLGFFAGNLFGAVIGVTLILTKKMRRDQQIPYGVFLAMGASLAIFAGPELLDPLQRFH